MSDHTAQITKMRTSHRTIGKGTAMNRLLAILLGVALAGPALGASLMPAGKQAYVTSSGAPLAGGKVYTYAAGTSTPLATYSDVAGTIPNANPVVLDARGEATIFWGAGPYKVTLTTAADALVWTQDYLYPPFTASEPLRLYSGGNVSTPELTWTGDTDTGFYRIGSGSVGLSLNGVQHFRANTTENVFVLQTYSDVSFGAPSHWGRGGGVVTFGTFDAYDAIFSTSGVERMRIGAAGDATFAGSVTVSGVARFAGAVYADSSATFASSVTVPTPSATTDAANKAYVDAVYSGTTGITWGTGWSDESGNTRLYKSSNGLVTLHVSATLGSGTGSLILTLPEGYRPNSYLRASGVNMTSISPVQITVRSDGQAYIGLGTITTGQSYGFSIAFQAQ